MRVSLYVFTCLVLKLLCDGDWFHRWHVSANFEAWNAHIKTLWLLSLLSTPQEMLMHKEQ